MPKEIILNKEQREILDHAEKNGIYCGDSKSMDGLCDKGLMEPAGFKSFAPDPYYQITRKGKNVTRN